MTDTWFSNNPAKSVSHSSELNLSCSWSTDDGFVGLIASETALGQRPTCGSRRPTTSSTVPARLSLSRSAFEATFDLYSK